MASNKSLAKDVARLKATVKVLSHKNDILGKRMSRVLRRLTNSINWRKFYKEHRMPGILRRDKARAKAVLAYLASEKAVERFKKVRFSTLGNEGGRRALLYVTANERRRLRAFLHKKPFFMQLMRPAYMGQQFVFLKPKEHTAFKFWMRNRSYDKRRK